MTRRYKARQFSAGGLPRGSTRQLMRKAPHQVLPTCSGHLFHRLAVLVSGHPCWPQLATEEWRGQEAAELWWQGRSGLPDHCSLTCSSPCPVHTSPCPVLSKSPNNPKSAVEPETRLPLCGLRWPGRAWQDGQHTVSSTQSVGTSFPLRDITGGCSQPQLGPTDPQVPQLC